MSTPNTSRYHQGAATSTPQKKTGIGASDDLGNWKSVLDASSGRQAAIEESNEMLMESVMEDLRKMAEELQEDDWMLPPFMIGRRIEVPPVTKKPEAKAQ